MIEASDPCRPEMVVGVYSLFLPALVLLVRLVIRLPMAAVTGKILYLHMLEIIFIVLAPGSFL